MLDKMVRAANSESSSMGGVHHVEIGHHQESPGHQPRSSICCINSTNSLRSQPVIACPSCLNAGSR